MMGMSFDGVGKYVGWSNIFDYSSLKAIQASEYLPMPNNTEFVKDDLTGFNIDNYVQRLNNAEDRVDRIEVYADLLTYLNDNNITDITWTIEPNEDILEVLLKHERTNIPKKMLEMASKNFISSHILNTVLNFTNMVGAYSPIEIEALNDASTKSPKGERSKRMTLMNPATKYLMQFENITGKNVIGIAATGIKAAFTWHYYMNEILLNNVNGSNAELIKRASFLFKTSRIKDRAKATKNNILDPNYDGTFIIESIPDINWDNISEESKKLLFLEGGVGENVLIASLTVDLMQSLVLSAATDNAKELILRKINAGSKLAKCYLFLITMGFDIVDIVSFMTSPIVDFIDNLTESNIYLGSSLKIEEVIDLLNGEIPSKLLYKFLTKEGAEVIDNETLLKMSESFLDNKLDSVKNIFPKNDNDYYGFIDLISELKLIRSMMPEMNETTKADLEEFQHILEGADEFSNFGRLLGINQGIKTTETEFKSYLQFIQNIIALRENKLNLRNIPEDKLKELGYDPDIVGKFDVVRWLSDQEYKETIKEYYSKIKIAIPIFDIIDTIDLYKASYKLVDVVNTINNLITLTTRIQDLIYSKYVANFWSDRFKNNLQRSIYAKFILQFLYTSNLRFPYLGTQLVEETIDDITTTKVIPGAKIINNTFDEVEASLNSFLTFDSLQQLASFKYIFETYVIPKLKEGKYTTVENGKIVEKFDDRIKQNKFILGLIEGSDNDLPLYRVNVDMLNYDQTPEGTIKVENYIKGIQALQGIDINGTSLSDWFILYNLYTNYNNYGSSRLTTLFDSFIDNNGKSSIIKDFLNYIGKLGYYGLAELILKDIIQIKDDKGNSFTIDINDLFMMSAVTVSNTYGKGDPMYRVVTDNGSTFFKRDGSRYVPLENSYFSGDTSEKTISRLNIIDGYLRVGGLYQEYKKLLIDNLNSLNYETISSLNLLKQDGFLKLKKVCL